MARPLRLELAGGIHHVTARANAGALLFVDDQDRERFLDCYADVIRRHGWFSLAYCLMGTHYHLLAETPRANLAQGMRDLNGSFARAWHKRRGSHGHLFGGRYFSRLVQRDAHLLEATRYIVRNPVEANLCEHPREWDWSSYLATYQGTPTPVLEPSRLLRYFESSQHEDDARARYRAFVDRDDPVEPPEDVGVHGDREFARRHVPAVPPSPAIPRRFSSRGRPSLGAILASAKREEAAVTAHRAHGYKVREIAAALNVHETTVGRWVRKHAPARS